MTTRRRPSFLEKRRLGSLEKKFSNHYEAERHELETAITHVRRMRERKEITDEEMKLRLLKLRDKLNDSHAREGREMHGM